MIDGSRRKEVLMRNEILLVDDDTIFVNKLRRLLQNRFKNCDFIEAKNGKEALCTTNNHRFDLIICDYEMPVMDGREFISGIRKWGLQTPVILLTTLYLAQSYSQMGFTSFVHKSDTEVLLPKEVRKFIAV